MLDRGRKIISLSQTERQISLDICKGICILLVIVGHQFQKYSLVSLMQVIYSFHMPLMFIISGMLIKSDPLITFIRKKAKRLLWPYFIAVCVMTVAETCKSLIFHKGNPLGVIVHDVAISFYGGGNGQGTVLSMMGVRFETKDEIGMLWFLLALFWGSIIVRAVILKDKPWIYIVSFSIIGYYTSKLLWLPFSVQNGLTCTFWLYLGYLIKNGKDSRFSWIRKPYFVICGMVCWIISCQFGMTHLFANEFRYPVIEIMGAVFASAFFFKISELTAQNTCSLKRALSWIGRNTMPIYVFHFWENRLFPMSRIVGGFGIENRLFASLTSSAFVIIICLLGTAVWNKWGCV